jgi:hypothetical protein
MNDQAAKRRELLLGVYRQSGGDVSAFVDMADLAESLGWTVDGVRVMAGQLAAKEWIEQRLNFEGGHLQMTMRGIEEAEHLSRSAASRWIAEHTFVFTLLIAVVTAVVGAFAAKLVELLFK